MSIFPVGSGHDNGGALMQMRADMIRIANEYKADAEPIDRVTVKSLETKSC